MAHKTLKNSINQNIYFSKNDIVKVPRSTFFMKATKRFDFDMGKLIPVGKPIDVLPGDTFDLSLACVTKLLSPQIKPVLDTLKQNFYCFFVPYRLVEKDFEKIFTGHEKTTQWNDETSEVMSTIKIPNGGGFPQFSVADYMGLPTWAGAKPNSWSNETILAAYFRGYAMVWNYYFRDENLQEAINEDNSNMVQNGAIELTNDIYDTNNNCLLGGNLLPTNKTHDYFTSALPAPQKGKAVTLNLGDSVEVVNDLDLSKIDTSNSKHLFQLFAASSPASGVGDLFTNYQAQTDSEQADYSIRNFQENYANLQGYYSNNGAQYNPANFLQFGQNSVDGISKNNVGLVGITPMGGWFKSYDQRSDTRGGNESFTTLPSEIYHNLKADLSKATAISINDLRYAFQLQLIKEVDARHGTRFSEYLLGHYGVSIGDARIQQPEFLGMMTFELKSITIPQTSSSSDESPQANLSAYSETGHFKKMFTKSFVEPGFVIILTTVRQAYQVYYNKVDKEWSKKTRWDFYLPELKNIGEQPILNKELHWNWTGTPSENYELNNEVFGYQEAWAQYRYMVNEVMGSCRPNNSQNLSVYSYVDFYADMPTLSPEWIKSNDAALINTLAIKPNANLKTFLSDIYIINKATRPMPLHSIPGLIDHSGKIII